MLRPLLQRARAQAKAVRGTLHNAAVLSRGLGQFQTMVSERSVDADGEPIPWFTYPAIEYLKQLDLTDMTVFEFGAGYSTLFWARRCKNVVTVEHDANWIAEITAAAPDNLRLIRADGEEAYSAAIESTGLEFDVVVIDGWYRDACAVPALNCLRSGGMVVLDNSDWLPRTCDVLRARDLLQVDFSGFGPVCHWIWTTSLFLDRDFRVPLRAPAPVGATAAPVSARGR